ncbi:MAG: hypothetical protein IJW52_06315 [Clostridia bacterium]|nr:hypothetical protein [Clostridia bacterium]
MKLFRIILVCLSLIITLSFIACSDVSSDEGTVEVTEEKKEPIFLTLSAEGSADEAFLGFGDAKAYGLGVSEKKVILEDMKGKTIECPLGTGSVFTYFESRCAPKNKATDEYGSFYSVYDIYFDEKGNERIYLRNSEEPVCVLFFSLEGLKDVKLSPDDLETARAASDAFLLKFFSQDTLNNYENVKAEVDDNNMYRIHYARYICGYKTDEYITVYVNKEGYFYMYVAWDVKKYDEIASKIDKSELDAAKDLLLEKIESLGDKVVKIGDAMITTDTEGNVYLKMPYEYMNKDESKRGGILYVSIN